MLGIVIMGWTSLAKGIRPDAALVFEPAAWWSSSPGQSDVYNHGCQSTGSMLLLQMRLSSLEKNDSIGHLLKCLKQPMFC